MSAYEDAIERAQGLLDGGAADSEYKRALIELCASFDPERPMNEAVDRARQRIEYDPMRGVEFTIRVDDMDLSDDEVSAMIHRALVMTQLPFHITSEIEVAS